MPCGILGVDLDSTQLPSSTEELNGDKMVIYPNPADQTASIEFPSGLKGSTEVVLMELTGQIIRTIYSGPGNAVGREVTLSISDIASGLYLIRLADESGYSSQKLVVSH